MYKIQLHPTAAAFHVATKEAADKVVGLYRSLSKYGITAAPFFAYPVNEEKVKKHTTRYGAILCSTFGKNTRGNYLEALKVAIKCLRDREAGKYEALYAPAFGVDTEEEAAAYEAAEAEALDILTLIAEYNHLPK